MTDGGTKETTASATWGAALLMLMLVLSLAACSGKGPAEVPLALLAAEQETYDGRTVRTSGTVAAVRDYDAGDPYFVLEDVAQNRVRLVPGDTVAAHEGDTVAVTGVFRFQPDSGRELQVEAIAGLP